MIGPALVAALAALIPAIALLAARLYPDRVGLAEPGRHTGAYVRAHTTPPRPTYAARLRARVVARQAAVAALQGRTA